MGHSMRLSSIISCASYCEACSYCCKFVVCAPCPRACKACLCSRDMFLKTLSCRHARFRKKEHTFVARFRVLRALLFLRPFLIMLPSMACLRHLDVCLKFVDAQGPRPRPANKQAPNAFQQSRHCPKEERRQGHRQKQAQLRVCTALWVVLCATTRVAVRLTGLFYNPCYVFSLRRSIKEDLA